MIIIFLTPISHSRYTVFMKLKTYLKGKNRREFAKQIGTTKGYVDLLCCGARRPSPELAKKIMIYTGGKVTLEELLFPSEISG